MRVLVIGGTGMLGSALVSVLGRNAAIELYATFRVPWVGKPPGPGVKKWFMFRAGQSLPPSVEIGRGDWIVNAAGLIRHKMREDTPSQAAEAIQANSLLPYELAEVCHRTGASLVHATTDCVFSGTVTGRTALNRYQERAFHDARSLYGRSKSMGEVMGFKRVLNLRCSIVGPEPRGRHSLLEWFLSQPEGSKVAGYADHYWNGVTTLALAKAIEGLILYGGELDLPSLHHLVPHGSCSKSELLTFFGEHFGHKVQIEPRKAGGIDRTLGTSQQDLNNRLWAVAGYEKPPTIEEMVAELARWVRSGGYPFKEVPQ